MENFVLTHIPVYFTSKFEYPPRSCPILIFESTSMDVFSSNSEEGKSSYSMLQVLSSNKAFTATFGQRSVVKD